MSLTIFAQRMKQARERKGLKQNELAKLIGVTPTTVSSYEKSDDEGNGKKPTLENAQSIAKALDVSLDWLSGMSDSISADFINFTARDYFKSLVTLLMETSTAIDSDMNEFIVLNNPAILAFAVKVADLIKVYRAGSIPEDLFRVCIDKILDDYNRYDVFGNCIMTVDAACLVEMDIIELLSKESKLPVQVLSIDVSTNNFDSTKVNVFLSSDMIKHYQSLSKKEVPDNGKHKPKNE